MPHRTSAFERLTTPRPQQTNRPRSGRSNQNSHYSNHQPSRQQSLHPQNTPLNAPVDNVPKAFSVTEVNNLVADVLNANMPSVLSIEGEISNFSLATSGHRYFSLKDANSTISCALFRGSANRIARDILAGLKNGDKVVVKASLSVYAPRGGYQLIVNDIEPAGFGALARAFAELKQKLDRAGLTASERKRPIPAWADSIAVVTSTTGAAIRDVLTTLSRRAPFIPVAIYPTLVQGQYAPEQIVAALAEANQSNASVILLVRGGGSLEDLQAFNHERVAMAVVNSRLPVVTGVGHETDFTIVDFVSDARAPTPTAAAEWVSPDKQALAQALNKQRQRLHLAVTGHLDAHQRQLLALSKRLQVQHPERNLQLKNHRLAELSTRFSQAMQSALNRRGQDVDELSHRLSLQHPHQRLAHDERRLSTAHMRLHNTVYQRIERQKAQLAQLEKRLMSHSPQQQLAHERQRLTQATKHLQQRLEYRLEIARQRLLRDAQQSQQTIKQRLETERQRVANATQRMARYPELIAQQQKQLKGLEARLTLLSPLGILGRGYALAFDDEGTLLRDAETVSEGQRIRVRLANGELIAVVGDVSPSR